jgi:sugar phosphate isomerase/epimerase
MKNLLIILTILVITLLPEENHAQQAGTPVFTGEIGIAPYTFRKVFPHGVAPTLDIIKNMGFTQIEGGGGDMDAREYKKLCDERGLSIPSSGAGYEQLRDDPMPVIERAKIYGSKYVMCAWIPHKVGSFSIDDAKKAVVDFNAIGKKLAENGLTLAYHVHGYELSPYGNGTLLDYIMENTNPEYVSFEMDIFWVHFGGGDPVALLRKYPNRWKMLHVKDMKTGIEKNYTGLTDPTFDVTLGTGQVDVEGVMKAAREIGIEYYFIEDESDRIMEQIPKSIAYLRGLTY